MLCCEISVLGTNILIRLSQRVVDLNVACEVAVAIVGGEIAECFIGDIRYIKLMVSNGQKVIVYILKDRVRILAIQRGGIRNTGAVMKIT
jgi:hypothetical protein